MKLNKIYFLGNPLFEADSLPVKIIPYLKRKIKNIEFIHLDPTEEFPEEDSLVIIDTVINVKDIVILTEKELDKIEKSPNYSLHDFDLAMSLKLAKKLGKLNRFMIIGLPPEIEKRKALKRIQEILNPVNL